MVAHAVMVELIGVQAKYFNIPELENAHLLCAQDHVEIWTNRNIAVNPNE
jgi:hypothetical protein